MSFMSDKNEFNFFSEIKFYNLEQNEFLRLQQEDFSWQ